MAFPCPDQLPPWLDGDHFDDSAHYLTRSACYLARELALQIFSFFFFLPLSTASLSLSLSLFLSLVPRLQRTRPSPLRCHFSSTTTLRQHRRKRKSSRARFMQSTPIQRQPPPSSSTSIALAHCHVVGCTTLHLYCMVRGLWFTRCLERIAAHRRMMPFIGKQLAAEPFF